jgi:hypothetical protein
MPLFPAGEVNGGQKRADGSLLSDAEIIDAVVPGMLHAVLARPPANGAEFLSLDEEISKVCYGENKMRSREQKKRRAYRVLTVYTGVKPAQLNDNNLISFCTV